MKIMYYRGDHPNFGDELNLWMFPKIFPTLFDDQQDELFIGIGSTLGNHYNDSAKKIVFGTGFVPQYQTKPLLDNKWKVYFVRGPRTAALLDLSPDLAIGDSAIMVRTLIDYKNREPEVVSFIPHWESMMRGKWEEVCKLLGMNLIDPRKPVTEVMNEILRSKFVVTEAMHGAIVSDALRVPWIPVLPLDAVHRHKWADWAEALNLNFNQNRLWPSSISEAKHALRCRSNIVKILTLTENPLVSTISQNRMIHFAAHRLDKLSRTEQYLSEDKIIENVTQKMLEKASLLARDYNVKYQA